MSHKISPKQQRIVAQEIKQWQQESLIGNDLASTLLSRYADCDRKTNLSGVLSLIGSILVGLGTILFVAANWHQISVVIKLLLIVAAIFTANFFGWRFKFEPGNRPKLGSALLVLGSLFYGAGIWLVSQIFNIDTTFSDGVLLWAAGTLATTVVTRTVPLGCITALLLGAWSLSKMDYSFLDKPSEMIPLVYFGINFVTSMSLGVLLRSRAVAWIGLLSSGAFMVAWSGSNQALLLWGLATFGGYMWCKEKRPLFASPFLYVSTISFLGSLMVATSEAYQWISHANVTRMGVMLFAAMTMLMLVIWKVEKYRAEAAVAIMLAVAGCMCYGYAEGATRILSNIMLLSAIAGLVYSGLNRIQSAGLVNVAVVFFVIDVIARYFDFFYTMMNRSLFFIIGGVVLMVVGSMVETGRRKMVEGLNSETGGITPQHA